MSPLLAGAGALVLLAVFYDSLTTTLGASRAAGPITRRLSGLLWRVLLRLHRRREGSRLLSAAGPVLLITTVLLWVIGLWAGWTLVLLGEPGAVLDADTGAPGGTLDVVYYAGFTVFTLGVGDFVASSPGMRVLTAVASFTGLSLITLAITYLVSVISAVVSRRALAVTISALGPTSGEMVARGWTRGSFSPEFLQQLVNLTGQLASAGEQHLAYPVLHYFHSRTRQTAAPPALAQLDDALLILDAAVLPQARPSPAAVLPLRSVLDRYLSTVADVSTAPVESDAPPPPDLAPVAAAGIPLDSAERFAERVADHAERRRRLATVVAGDGWSW